MGDVDSDGEMSCPGARARDRVRFQERCMSRIGFQTEIRWGSDVRASMTLRYSLVVRHREEDGDGMGSGIVNFRVGVRCLLRCKGRLGSQLELSSNSDVRDSMRLCFRVMVKCA